MAEQITAWEQIYKVLHHGVRQSYFIQIPIVNFRECLEANPGAISQVEETLPLLGAILVGVSSRGGGRAPWSAIIDYQVELTALDVTEEQIRQVFADAEFELEEADREGECA